ncbi:MAG TPA: tRNA-binding protein [archaeon]|nr:tRNA-binding protein [archaeon]
MTTQISYEDFRKVDIRVGRVIAVEDFPEAKKPAYKLIIDFGKEIGIKKSSAQICKYYKKEDLFGKLVVGVVNFPAKQIGPFKSEVLTVGFDGKDGIVIAIPEKEVEVGKRLY